ncbi:MAG: hypothetical protein J5773_07830, partial [Verrucomicrobia bacterium]|nr:hypothetical protein [Verrucomicrobiota bacterium]
RIPSKYLSTSKERQPTPRARPFLKKGKIQPDTSSSLELYHRRPAAAERVSRMMRNAQNSTPSPYPFNLFF